MTGYFKKLFLNTWTNAEKKSIENNSVFPPGSFRLVPIVILIYIAIGLSIVKYYGNTDFLLIHILDKNPSTFARWFCSFFYGSETGVFHQKLYWVVSITLIYMVLPIFIIKFIFKQKISDFGFSFKNIHRDYPLYLLMLAIMLPMFTWLPPPQLSRKGTHYFNRLKHHYFQFLYGGRLPILYSLLLWSSFSEASFCTD